MKVTKIDRKVCDMISKDMTAAMEAVATKYGLKLESAGGRFSPESFSKKFEVKVMSTEGVDVKAKKTFETYADMYGLKPENVWYNVYGTEW